MSKRYRLRMQQLHAWLCPSFPAGSLRLGWSGGDSSLCCQTVSVPGAKDLGGFVPAPIHTAFSLQTKTQGLVTERCCYGYANGDEGTILNWGHQCDCSLAFSLLLRPRYRKRHRGQLTPAARRPQRSPQGTRSALPPIGNDGTLLMCIIPFQLFSK